MGDINFEVKARKEHKLSMEHSILMPPWLIVVLIVHGAMRIYFSIFSSDSLPQAFDYLTYIVNGLGGLYALGFMLSCIVVHREMYFRVTSLSRYQRLKKWLF